MLNLSVHVYVTHGIGTHLFVYVAANDMLLIVTWMDVMFECEMISLHKILN